MGDAFKAVTNTLGITSRDQPDIPNIKAPVDIINELLGVETRMVKDEEGNERLVTSLNLSDEEQARLDQLQGMYDSYVVDLENLTKISAAIDDPTYEPVLNAVREQQADARKAAYNERAMLEEETLARRGLADSTAGGDVREQRGKVLQEQIRKDENALTLMAEDLRNAQIQRTGQSLSFATNKLTNDLNQRVTQGNTNAGQQFSWYTGQNNMLQTQYQNQLGQYTANVARDAAITGQWTDIAANIATGGMSGAAKGATGGSSTGGMYGGGYTNTQNAGTINWYPR